MKNILITGGSGFIGSHLVQLFVKYENYHIFNLDALTYAANKLHVVEPNYTFIHGDITDKKFIDELFEKYKFEGVIHLAAESHVDRSIIDPLAFVNTNVLGTVNLLNAFYNTHKDDYSDKLFHHVSTDEVYGSLGAYDLFTETTPYSPNSPYSASKASSDHFVRAYGETYGLPYVITNCSNNYGPHQHDEKFIPTIIRNVLELKPIPIYGDGKYYRDWLYVKDHVEALDLIFHSGLNVTPTFNIGGFNEQCNLDVVELICDKLDFILGREKGTSNGLITFVKDRPGHDFRYAIDSTKLTSTLGWRANTPFHDGLDETISWYLPKYSYLKKKV
jgi:dTDP-glucose 4,6-dehydratase